MCDPGTAMAAAGGGMQAYGAYEKGQTDAENYVDKSKFSALQADMYSDAADAALGNLALLRTQAQIAHGNVAIAQSKGTLDESRVLGSGNSVLTRQKLAFAYRNIDPTYGSPLVMAANTAGDIETDIGLVRASTAINKAQALTGEANIDQQALGQANAAVTARGNAVLSLNNASTYLRNAGQAGQAGILGAATALLTTGSKIWDMSSSKAAAAAAG